MLPRTITRLGARLWRRGPVLILVLVLVISLALFALAEVGKWLMVADPLQHAQAIVVLTGHLPFRAMEAASLYHQGWASEIWLTKGERVAAERALARLGIQVVGEETYNRAVLERLGVPPGAIRMLDGRVQNIRPVSPSR